MCVCVGSPEEDDSILSVYVGYIRFDREEFRLDRSRMGDDKEYWIDRKGSSLRILF